MLLSLRQFRNCLHQLIFKCLLRKRVKAALMTELCHNFRDSMAIISIDEYLFVDPIDRDIHIKKDFSLSTETFTHTFA